MANELQRMKMSQDKIYEFLTAHDVKVSRIAELMGKTPQAIISCFRHHNNAHGYPRRFSVENIRQLNDALAEIARELRGCMLEFDTSVEPNSRGVKYDKGLIDPINHLGKLLNMTSMLERLLGWTKNKKLAVFSTPSSKIYGHISENDATIINIEVNAIAGVLESVEVVPDENAFEGYASR